MRHSGETYKHCEANISWILQKKWCKMVEGHLFESFKGPKKTFAHQKVGFAFSDSGKTAQIF